MDIAPESWLFEFWPCSRVGYLPPPSIGLNPILWIGWQLGKHCQHIAQLRQILPKKNNKKKGTYYSKNLHPWRWWPCLLGWHIRNRFARHVTVWGGSIPRRAIAISENRSRTLFFACYMRSRLYFGLSFILRPSRGHFSRCRGGPRRPIKRHSLSEAAYHFTRCQFSLR